MYEVTRSALDAALTGIERRLWDLGVELEHHNLQNGKVSDGYEYTVNTAMLQGARALMYVAQQALTEAVTVVDAATNCGEWNPQPTVVGEDRLWLEELDKPEEEWYNEEEVMVPCGCEICKEVEFDDQYDGPRVEYLL